MSAATATALPNTPPIPAPVSAPLPRTAYRCHSCSLPQFMTASGMCRRCHQPIIAIEPEKDETKTCATIAVSTASTPNPLPSSRSRIQSSSSAKLSAVPAPSSVFNVSIEHTLLTLPFTLFLFRIRRGWTQKEMGVMMGTRRTYISKIEQGRSAPTVESVFRWARTLGVTVPEIMLTAEWLAGVVRKREQTD